MNSELVDWWLIIKLLINYCVELNITIPGLQLLLK